MARAVERRPGERAAGIFEHREAQLAPTLLAGVAMAGVLAGAAGLPILPAAGWAALGMAIGAVAFLCSAERRLGAANAVTIARLGLAASLLAQLAVPADRAFAWPVAAIAALILLLDGVDGWLARRRRTVSVFGARLDMEADTLFMAILAALLVGGGRIGAWLLLVAVLRPAFVLAKRLWPELGAPLPPSMRRKLVCVVALLLLILAASPLAGAQGAPVAGGLALGLLVGSFAVDMFRLLQRPAVAA